MGAPAVIGVELGSRWFACRAPAKIVHKLGTNK